MSAYHSRQQRAKASWPRIYRLLFGGDFLYELHNRSQAGWHISRNIGPCDGSQLAI